jgi:hypothetical protein
VPKESVSLDVKRAFPFRLDGRARPGRTASSTAVPCVLLTRKRSQVQTLSRPPLFSLVKDLSAPSRQRSSRAAAAARPQAAPPPNRVGPPELDATGPPSPNDHAAWSPAAGPGLWSAPRRRERPGRPAGAGEHLPPMLPAPAGTLAWTSARVGPLGPRRRRRRDAGHTAALGQGRPSCEPATPTPPPPSRPARGRQATTPPADHGARRPVGPNWGRPATPSHSRSSAARTTWRQRRGHGACPSGRLDTGRLDTGRLDVGRPLDRLDGHPPRRDRGRGQGNDQPGRRPDILAPATTRWAARPRPGHGAWGARPPRTAPR